MDFPLCRDEVRGRYLAASRDLIPGETLIVEKPFASILHVNHGQVTQPRQNRPLASRTSRITDRRIDGRTIFLPFLLFFTIKSPLWWVNYVTVVSVIIDASVRVIISLDLKLIDIQFQIENNQTLPGLSFQVVCCFCKKHPLPTDESTVCELCESAAWCSAK